MTALLSAIKIHCGRTNNNEDIWLFPRPRACEAGKELFDKYGKLIEHYLTIHVTLGQPRLNQCLLPRTYKKNLMESIPVR